MDNLNNIDPQMWNKIDKSKKDAEKVERPNLTYWQDAWRRIKQNKVAMVSLVVIVLVILSAIIMPMVWKFKYSDQNLELANIPRKLEIYKLTEQDYIYITKDYKAIKVTSDGNLLGMADVINNDMTNRKRVYDVAGKEFVIDYSLYFNAKVEFNNLSKKAKKDPTIDLLAAEHELNNAKKYEVFYDGQLVEVSDKVSNKTYILGSDSLGRDLFIRIFDGARISLTIGFVAAFINFVIGILYGGISGYFGGRVDNIMMRIVDVISTIPMMLYVILLTVVFEPGMKSIIIAMSITYWVRMARIVRGQVLSLREQEFVLAAQTLGASTKRILLRHIIPNVMGPVMVALNMQIPAAIFNEAFLSFIGLGVSAPRASWGSLCNDALQGLYTYPYQLFYPALAISITILAFNLFGDGLRDALDPRLRK